MLIKMYISSSTKNILPQRNDAGAGEHAEPAPSHAGRVLRVLHPRLWRWLRDAEETGEGTVLC